MTSQHFQSLWSKRGWQSTLKSRPAVWWSLGSNIGVVASVRNTTETNATFRDTLKLLIFRPAHTLASFATHSLKPGDHFRDMKLLCTNNAECLAVKRHFLSVFVEQHKIGGYVEKQCVPMMDPGGLKYWTCGICNKALNHKQDLMRHVESFHVETSPYICQLCLTNVEFKTKRGLQRHINANHK